MRDLLQQAPVPSKSIQELILWKGYRESRKCSRDTYPELYITKYTRTRRETRKKSDPPPHPKIGEERATAASKWIP